MFPFTYKTHFPTFLRWDEQKRKILNGRNKTRLAKNLKQELEEIICLVSFETRFPLISLLPCSLLPDKEGTCFSSAVVDSTQAITPMLHPCAEPGERLSIVVRTRLP